MSSRVQKGSTVFKPVVKSRARTSAPSVSRQTSVAVEQPSAEGSSTQISLSRSEQSVLFHDTSVPFVTPSIETSAFNNGIPTQGLGPDLPSSAYAIPASTSLRSATPIPIVIGMQPSLSPAALPPAQTSTVLLPERRSVPPPIQATPSMQPLENFVLNASTLRIPSELPPSAGATPGLANPTEMRSTSEDRQEGSSKGRQRRKSGDDGASNPKRRRTKKNTEEGSERERSKSQESRSRSRGSSRTPRPRRRAPSPPPYDPDADPGEQIDPTAMTMAALCVDLGQGRVSTKAAEILTNHASWKLKNREKRARMRAVMEAKKFGKTEEEAEAEEGNGGENQDDGPQPSSSDTAGPSTTTPDATPAIVDSTGHGFDYSQNLSTSRYNVQVRIGPNGETMFDEDSLVVDRTENDGTENYTHVTESDYTKFVNSASYGKRFRGSRWSAEETELFYEALSQYGENYELIAYVLPGRDRKACKNKFKSEDKKNAARITYCLTNSVPVDMKTLSRMTGKDFSGPVPEIRAPPKPPAPVEVSEAEQDALPRESRSKPPKKRSRSKSQGLSDAGVVVIGDAQDFQD